MINTIVYDLSLSESPFNKSVCVCVCVCVWGGRVYYEDTESFT